MKIAVENGCPSIFVLTTMDEEARKWVSKYHRPGTPVYSCSWREDRFYIHCSTEFERFREDFPGEIEWN